MSTLKRCGTLALCTVICLIAALRSPADATRVPVQPADATVPAAAPATGPAMTPATAVATEITGVRGELIRVKPLQPELIVSIGRFRWSWSKDVREFSSRMRGLTGVLCLAASRLRLVDDTDCRKTLAVGLQDILQYITAYLFTESRP